MVLPDSSQSDSMDDTTPPSDTDPYFSPDSSSSSSSFSTLPYNIDTTNFPKPVPVISPIFGFTPALQSKIIQKRLQEMQHVLKRPPTHDEANALAYWSAKQLSLYSYGPPVGIAGGCYRAYATMSTFQFPFFKPNPETFTPTVFPPVMPFLGGRAAVIAWHVLRFFTYGVTGNFISQVLFGSYSVSVATVGEMGDPRLKNYLEAVRRMSRERMGAAVPHAGGPGSPGPLGQPQQPQRLPQSQKRPMVDDASPTAGSYGDEDFSYGDAPSPDSGDRYQSSNPQQKPVQQPQSRSGLSIPQRTRPSTVPTSPSPSASLPDSSQPFDFFDEASPTGGQGSVDTPSFQQQQQRAKITTSPSGESSWAKIRAGALSSSPGSTPRPSQTVEGGESQQEFDAKLEKKRRDGDFNGGSEQKRW
ncbi:hypothetical protein F5884DRAFT_373044 [Xylogone sp. PMI_703]|nr:hypothetical protein F5884DRAFT_373044 [Xylogone sp. PMI_703]